MNSFSAYYCDGEFARSHSVELQLLPDGDFHLHGSGIDRRIPRADTTISARLGSLPRFVRLADGGTVEIPDTDELAASLDAAGLRPARSANHLVHWLESHSAIAAVATLLLVAAVALTFWQGLPRLARRGAHAVPLEVEEKAGWAAYSVLTRSFAPTALSYNDRMHVHRSLDRLVAVDTPHVEPRLLFFQMGAPNAFALPGGIIVVADELYHLAANDDEMAAVLAHELGHVAKRHGVQSVLRNSAALVLVSTITGDLSALSSFSATLPFLLLRSGYAREFEQEADAHAAQLLRKAGIAPSHLANILKRLESARPARGRDLSYLNTHPPTASRVQQLEASSDAKQPAN